tara:strand:- start:283 stop:444 length:162 start_codon:yes stop_codon:yes gene_type:complete
MNKYLIAIIFFLISCTSNSSRNEFNFSDEMSFDEFRLMLDEYAKNNPYPNVDG